MKGMTRMGDRIDELQGKTKEGVGNLTGNEEMAREGEAQADAAKLKRETEGAIDKGVGKAQETLGDVIDDEDMEAQGKARQAEGDLKRVG
jgi:uncharacterized protein YjbJ (UPF0337 family)